MAGILKAVRLLLLFRKLHSDCIDRGHASPTVNEVIERYRESAIKCSCSILSHTVSEEMTGGRKYCKVLRRTFSDMYRRNATFGNNSHAVLLLSPTKRP